MERNLSLARSATTDAPIVLDSLRAFAQSSSAFLGLSDDNRYFTTPRVPGLVIYRPFGKRYWVQFTGPCAAAGHQAELEQQFAAAAHRAHRRVIAVQLPRTDAERVAESGWVVNQFGCSYSIDLSDFTLRGQKFVKTRNMITRSRREGTTVSEADADRLRDPEFSGQLDAIDAEWLRDKGRHVKEMRFLIGQRGGPMQQHRRLFVAEQDGRVVAYVSYSPVFGAQPGWLYDLTRRRPDAPPGVIEHIFAEAAERLRGDGAAWMHLGLTPFVGLEPRHAIEGANSRMLGRTAELIRDRGAALYPATRQLAFKQKWRPHLETPEYIAFPNRIHLRDIWCLARITNAL
ncbi:DUF2156 domain-containing protein [Nocardia pseudovaccinii]|uniref:DUF2156 domain-containing protein n=1 Tax=Nocardia pseudovaccinii TaxID=189540 RepID=UPI000B22B9A4|nr:DUF2156 domain-containing protein [Nocardia pseudovaccinii]